MFWSLAVSFSRRAASPAKAMPRPPRNSIRRRRPKRPGREARLKLEMSPEQAARAIFAAAKPPRSNR